MTFLGKLLLMLNLMLSLLLAAAGFSIYLTNPDYSDKAPASPGLPAGQLVALTAEIQDLYKNRIAVSEATDRAVLTDLLKKEDLRREERLYYEAELKKLVGKGPVFQVKEQKAGVNETGRPEMVAAMDGDQPLLSRAEYEAKRDEDSRKNKALRAKLEEKLKEDAKLTNELAGDPDKKSRGLRREIGDERIKRQGIVDEQGIEESLRVNTEVESELILIRKDQLERRIAELKAYLKMKYKVDVAAKGR